MPVISAIVPCHNEQECLPLFVAEFERAAAQIVAVHADATFELVLVDDGSTDHTLAAFKDAEAHFVAGSAPAQVEVKWLSLSRNFGKEGALFAGLQTATGDFVALMDADLQDPPSLLPQMYEILLTEDFDTVATRRETRKGEPPVRSWFAHRFYHLINKLSQAEIVDGARDYRLMKRVVVDAVLAMGEYNRFSKGIFGWVGFKTKWLSYDNIERAAGKTNWNFWSLVGYAIEGIVAFSTNPLQIAAFSGVICCFAALIALVFVVVRAAVFGDPVAGWPSMVAIILLIGGIQLLCLGIFGEYLAKTYLETKKRPVYLVRESNFDKQTKGVASKR